MQTAGASLTSSVDHFLSQWANVMESKTLGWFMKVNTCKRLQTLRYQCRKLRNSIANKSEFASPLGRSCYLSRSWDILTSSIPAHEAAEDTGERHSRMERKSGCNLKRRKKNSDG